MGGGRQTKKKEERREKREEAGEIGGIVIGEKKGDWGVGNERR